MTRLMEGKKARGWHARVWDSVMGPRVLEVGVGTGRSLPYYPEGLGVTAIDLSGGMPARAKQRARDLGLSVNLRRMDVQKLDFPDDYFDTAVATCTFCSVPDPVLGLEEIRRTLKPDGRVLLLEHMRHDNRVLGALMDWMESPCGPAHGPVHKPAHPGEHPRGGNGNRDGRKPGRGRDTEVHCGPAGQGEFSVASGRGWHGPRF